MPDNEPNGTPAASDAAGQRPTTDGAPANNPTTTVPANDAASGGGQQPNQQDPIHDPLAKASAELEKYQRLLKAAEKKNADYEAKEKAAADAQLSEMERSQKQAAEWQQKYADTTRAYQERIVSYEIEKQASKLNIIDPDAAVKLMDWTQLEYDDDGMPKNADKVLAALVKDKAYLVAPPASGANGAQAATPAKPQPTSVGANPANPARGASSSGALSYEYIESLTQRQYAELPAARRQEILNWMAANPKPLRPQ